MFLTNADVFQPDQTVNPFHADPANQAWDDWEMEVKLPNLIRSAARFRRLAGQHKQAFWPLIRSARTARLSGDFVMHRDYLDDAIATQQRAAQYTGFARRCEKEANAIAVASGFLR